MKDHLGSIRVVIDGSDNFVEERDYYPFGLPMPGRYEKGSPPTQEDYTGHVKDGETGLHYAGARYYSAAFGIWNAVDPLAGDRPGWTPYAYAVGNPVNLMDPNGMEPCPYDKSKECGIILPEVVVTAEEPEETADAGLSEERSTSIPRRGRGGRRFEIASSKIHRQLVKWSHRELPGGLAPRLERSHSKRSCKQDRDSSCGLRCVFH
jgi:RHS repeat-associated protein